MVVVKELESDGLRPGENESADKRQTDIVKYNIVEYNIAPVIPEHAILTEQARKNLTSLDVAVNQEFARNGAWSHFSDHLSCFHRLEEQRFASLYVLGNIYAKVDGQIIPKHNTLTSTVVSVDKEHKRVMVSHDVKYADGACAIGENGFPVVDENYGVTIEVPMDKFPMQSRVSFEGLLQYPDAIAALFLMDVEQFAQLSRMSKTNVFFTNSLPYQRVPVYIASGHIGFCKWDGPAREISIK